MWLFYPEQYSITEHSINVISHSILLNDTSVLAKESTGMYHIVTRVTEKEPQSNNMKERRMGSL
jgi:hypothetical protein